MSIKVKKATDTVAICNNKGEPQVYVPTEFAEEHGLLPDDGQTEIIDKDDAKF